MKTHKFKILTKKDLFELKSLYEKGFDRKFDINVLKWAFFMRNSQFAFSCGLFNEEKIVAHTGFIPYKFVFQNHEINALLSIGSVSIKTGAFPIVYHECEGYFSNNYDLIYAFPNKISFAFFTKKFGFNEGFFEFLVFYNPQITTKVSQKFKNLKFYLKNKIFNPLEKIFLKWRLYSHPINKYKVFVAGELKIFYKYYKEREIDVIGFKSKKNVIDFIEFCNFINHFKDFRINMISTNKEFSQIAKKIGFKSANIPNRFVYKVLKKDKMPEENFFLNMIDNDIY